MHPFGVRTMRGNDDTSDRSVAPLRVIALVAAPLLARWLLPHALGAGTTALVLLPCVIAASRWFGARGAVLATVLGALALLAWHGAELGTAGPWIELALFAASGAFLAASAGRARRAGTSEARVAPELAGVERARRELGREPSNDEARLRDIFDAAVEGILSIDERGAVVAMNPAAERMFGYRAEEVLGRNVSMLMPSPYQGEHDGYLAAYLATGHKKIIGIGREVQGRRKNGSVFPLALSVSEASTGQRRVFSGFIRDLTETKRLEEEFLRSQKMEAVGRLAGGIAHDFNNLLMGVLAYSRIASEEHVGPTRDAFDEIGAAAKRGMALTRRLLAFTRGRPIQLEPTSVDQVVSENELMLRQLLGEDMTLEVRLARGGATVMADPGLIEQILINLLINARDAMPAGGRIEVVTRERTDAVVLAVRDTGCGMTPEVRERIFEPFFTTKAPGEGTGLGLSTVKRIVGQLAGSIDVESAPGKGSTFRLSIPRCAREPQRTLTPTREERSRSTRNTLLLVEDDRLVRTAIRHFLERQGYEVYAAEAPLEALRILREHGAIDVLLTDMVMPGGSGSELAREVCALRPDTKVVFMSAHEPEFLIERERLEPGATCLQKPFELELLLAVLLSLGRADEPSARAAAP